MLISEVEANTGFGRDLFNEQDPEDIINSAIELPLRKACKIFFKKNIKTVMSSANKHNVVSSPEEVIEKKDVIKSSWEFMSSSNPPTFMDAGKGYAWIMLDFDSLSCENKDWLFALEERKDKQGNTIGEKGIWFVQPSDMNALKFKVNLDSNPPSIEHVSEDESIKNIELDERLAEFKKRRILLAYHDRYPDNVVILRYPINEKTAVTEVEEYFAQLAMSFKSQEIKKGIDDSKTKGREELISKIKDREMDIN